MKRKMNFAKKVIEFVKRNKKKIEIIGIVILLILCAVVIGIARITKSDFNPINGDFQNYNPVRRLLDGQIPYKDFAVYLGSGHLFVFSFVQLLVGNNYTASLFVSNMVTMLLFELTVFAVSFFVLKDKRKALYFTLGITLINIVRPRFIVNSLEGIFSYALDFGREAGNSARLVRVAIMPIISLMLYLGFKFLNHSKKPFIVEHKSLLAKIYMALLARYNNFME